MARIFKSTTPISCTSMVVYLTTNSQAHILIIAVHSNVKTISCAQKLVIRILCASLAYKERVIRIHSNEGKTILRAVCCKDQLRSCNIEKTDFPKLCQNKGLGELVVKIQVSGRLDFCIFLGNFFCILRSQRPKLTPKLGIFRKLPFKK